MGSVTPCHRVRVLSGVPAVATLDRPLGEVMPGIARPPVVWWLGNYGCVHRALHRKTKSSVFPPHGRESNATCYPPLWPPVPVGAGVARWTPHGDGFGWWESAHPSYSIPPRSRWSMPPVPKVHHKYSVNFHARISTLASATGGEKSHSISKLAITSSPSNKRFWPFILVNFCVCRHYFATSASWNFELRPVRIGLTPPNCCSYI